MDLEKGDGPPEFGVSIKCSWSQVKNQLENAFSLADYTEGVDGRVELDACDTMAYESCVFISQEESSDEPPTIDLSSPNSDIIFKKIHIISEANFVEVYGLFGEYIKTAVGELIEDVDGTMAFSCLINDIHLSQVTLKFVGLKGATNMWLFGGRIWTQRDGCSGRTGQDRIDMDRIQSRLSAANCRLSPSADSLKKLVTEYVSRNPPSTSTSLGRGFPFGSGGDSATATTTQTFELCRSYVDSCIRNMESRILDNVTERIRELELRQNKKLDHILKLLENTVQSPPNNNP